MKIGVNMDYYVVTFYSTNYALKIERIMKKNDLNIKLIPVPRQVSSNCGLAARLDPEDYPFFKDLYKEGVIEVEGVYKVSKNDKDGKKLTFSLLEI